MNVCTSNVSFDLMSVHCFLGNLRFNEFTLHLRFKQFWSVGKCIVVRIENLLYSLDFSCSKLDSNIWHLCSTKSPPFWVEWSNYWPYWQSSLFNMKFMCLHACMRVCANINQYKNTHRLEHCWAETSIKQTSSNHVHKTNLLARSLPGLCTKFDQGNIGFSIFIVVYSSSAALLFPDTCRAAHALYVFFSIPIQFSEDKSISIKMCANKYKWV